MAFKILVTSQKGGVGKSTVAVNLACALGRLGAKVGLLDCDVYGPDVPMMMGIKSEPETEAGKLLPLEAKKNSPANVSSANAARSTAVST